MENKIICDDCFKKYDLDEIQFVDSESCYVCDKCLMCKYTLCDECGEYHLDEKTSYIDSYDIYVCEYCEENNFGFCDICTFIFKNDELEKVDDDFYCNCCKKL